MKGKIFIILGISGILLLAFGWFETHFPEILHLWIPDTHMKKILNDRIIIQLSDIHIQEIGRFEDKILRLIEELDPDIIFLTGDYIKWKGNSTPALNFLSRLKAKIGVWAVMGDYDYSNSRQSCLFCHEKGTGKPAKKHNIKFLKNSIQTIALEKGSILIGGIDQKGDSPFLFENIFKNIEKDTPLILLSHDPLAFDLLNKNQKVLMLAGDTHGGQVPIPSWIWKLVGYEKAAKYNQGLFREGQKTMYVNRGLGTSHIPIRIFRRPEITVFHF